MKSWSEYDKWLRLNNPKIFQAKEIKMTPKALIDRLEAAWNAGYRAAKEEKSIFDSVFGSLK